MEKGNKLVALAIVISLIACILSTVAIVKMNQLSNSLDSVNKDLTQIKKWFSIDNVDLYPEGLNEISDNAYEEVDAEYNP